MSRLDQIREAHTLLHKVKDEEVTFADFFEEFMPLEDMAELYIVADEWRKTAQMLVSIIDAALTEKIENGPQKTVQVGEIYLWRGEGTKETCIDSEGFFDWLEANPELTRRVFNPNYAKKGSLPEAARRTFFEKTKDGKVSTHAAPVQVIEDARQRRAMS